MGDVRKVTNWISGLVSALLLFVVVAHAVAPIDQEHGRHPGSAFSASTEEVLLKSDTPALVAKALAGLDPQGALPEVPSLVATAAADPASRPVGGRFGIAPPRISWMALGPIGPRAPPLA